MLLCSIDSNCLKNCLLSTDYRFGEKFSEEEADEFFALIDVNKDGIINYEEFVKYMLSEINRGPPPRQVKT